MRKGQARNAIMDLLHPSKLGMNKKSLIMHKRAGDAPALLSGMLVQGQLRAMKH
jgi:hypothetical protein